MSKRIIFSIALLFSLPSLVHALSFVEKDFKSFVNRVVDAPLREKFADYYGTVNARINTKNEEEKRELRADIYQTALKSMKTEHKAWAQDIQMLLSDVLYLDKSFDQERAEARDFLDWYGTYSKFRAATQATNKTKVAFSGKKLSDGTKDFLDNVRGRVTKVTSKVGDWFKNLRTSLT